MSQPLTARNTVNFGNEINIFEKTREQIDNEINPYLKIENVGKFIIMRDDSGEAQTDMFIAYQIINEAPRGETPLITTRIMNNGQYQYIPSFGGKVKKSKTKHRKTKHRKTKHSKSKKSKKMRVNPRNK
jgi:hypothetical protein